MKIGDVQIRVPLALAPMAGVADRAMREMCMAYGAAFCVGELTSAKGVSLGDNKSKQLLSCSTAQRPMGTQLFGADPATMAEAARIAESFDPDFLDLNMGCPAPKVVKNGGGSALMQNPKKAGEIIKAVVNAVSLPVTVKMRTGWDEGSENCVTLAKIAEQNGAAAVTVHGRTRQQMYAPGINYQAIAAVKKAVSIPVIANGDIATAADAAAMLERMGISAAVIDMPSIKPIDRELILKEAERTGFLVTCEEHSVIGGLGSAVCEVLAEERPTPVFRIGMRDTFGESGPARELLAKYKLDAEGIRDAIAGKIAQC